MLACIRIILKVDVWIGTVVVVTHTSNTSTLHLRTTQSDSEHYRENQAGKGAAERRDSDASMRLTAKDIMRERIRRGEARRQGVTRTN